MVQKLKMSNKDFLKIVDVGKLLKSEIVYFTPTMIYGCDEGFTLLKSIPYENIYGLTICYNQSNINAFIKGITDEVIIDITIIESGVTYSPINHPLMISKMCSLIGNVLLLKTNSPISRMETNISVRPDVFEAINLKADQGMRFIRLSEQYMLTLYKGLIPVNKDDTVDLEIRDITEIINGQIFDDKFMVTYIVNKNKPKLIKIIVDILHIKLQ